MYFFIALSIFFTLLYCPLFLQTRDQQRCCAMLVFVIMLWVFEVVDLYVTGLLVPVLTVSLGLLDGAIEP